MHAKASLWLKNSAYGRHRISRPMLIESPIQKKNTRIFLLLRGIWLSGGRLLCTLRQSPSQIFYLNIMVTCDQQEKVASSHKVLLGIFSTNRKFILKVCCIKPFMSGLQPTSVSEGSLSSAWQSSSDRRMLTKSRKLILWGLIPLNNRNLFLCEGRQTYNNQKFRNFWQFLKWFFWTRRGLAAVRAAPVSCGSSDVSGPP